MTWWLVVPALLAVIGGVLLVARALSLRPRGRSDAGSGVPLVEASPYRRAVRHIGDTAPTGDAGSSDPSAGPTPRGPVPPTAE